MLNPKSLSDDVASIIRKMIFNGELKPGERINQAKFAEKMNISRGPIREALKLLQNEGLINHETNRGTYVTTLSEKDAYEIYTLRALLEGEAAQLAIKHLSTADFKTLNEILQDLQLALEAKSLEDVAKCDIAFHHTIVKASRHQRLIQMHQHLDTQVGSMFFAIHHKNLFVPNKVYENHRILMEALTSNSLSKIKNAFSNHYVNALNELQQK